MNCPGEVASRFDDENVCFKLVAVKQTKDVFQFWLVSAGFACAGIEDQFDLSGPVPFPFDFCSADFCFEAAMMKLY